MHRRGFLTLLTAVTLSPASAAFAQRERPNFIVVFVDDMGYGDLSCYGNTRVKTPNIDRLASEGVRFTQFYANSPIRSPTQDRYRWQAG